MIVYRLGKKQYSQDLFGEGARLFGGRWNNQGISCLYTAESRALALVEYTLNISLVDVPKSLCFSVIEIPDNSIEEFSVDNLPINWNNVPALSASKVFGSNLLIKASAAVLKLPSAIITKEFNYLLNPNHIDSSKFKILEVEDFEYDVRMNGK